MKNNRLQHASNRGIILVIATLIGIAGVCLLQSVNHPPKVYATPPSATNPCPGNPAPAAWRHVVVLMFENKTYNQVIGSGQAPYIDSIKSQCGTAYSGTTGATPKNNWHDSNYKVDGTTDGNYVSKPSYATLTSGVSPTVHGLIDDTYGSETSADNIYNQLNLAGKDAKDYYDGPASTDPCGGGSNFSGAYHDAIRYYTNLGGHSTNTSSYCNTHDKPLTQFMTDVNAGNLPAFSMILPTNSENMHDNTIASGDTWAQNFLTPLLNSTQYQSGDTAIFFIWDEDTAIPDVLLAPSIVPGSSVPAPTGNPISHFSAARTWSEMLGITPYGVSAQAPSLLSFFNGSGAPPPDSPPAVSLTAPADNSTLTSSPVTVSASASDDHGVTRVEFYDGASLINTDTTAPYSFSWDISALSGAHTITAKAFDTAGQSTVSVAVHVTISIPNNCTPPTTYGTGTITVNVPSNGTYHVWSRIMAPDSTNNSYYAKFDATCPVINVGDSSSVASNTWTWLDYQDGSATTHTSVTLTAGNHTVTMIGREPGVKLDRVLLISDTCTPTGTGDNCITVADTTPPAVSMTAPAAGATVSGTTVTVSATASDNVGVAGVQFKLDGVNIGAEDTTSPYSITWDSTTATNGSHTLTAVARDAAGNSTTSTGVTITVNNSPGGLPGDCNADGHVTIIDLSTLLSNYAQAYPACDFNTDGIVNILDLSTLLSHYGT